MSSETLSRRSTPVPDGFYLANRSARRLQAELIANLFRRLLGIRISDEQAFVLAFYPSCSYSYSKFVEFSGIDHAHGKTIDVARIRALLEIFVAHVRVRASYFKYSESFSLRDFLWRSLRFLLIVARGKLFLPNRSYWMRYLVSDGPMPRDMFSSRAEVSYLKNRLRVAEDHYLSTIQEANIDSVSYLYSSYMKQIEKLRFSYVHTSKSIARSGLFLSKRTERQEHLRLEFREVLNVIEREYVRSLEMIRELN